jgi:DNA-binding IclR family transcriptional regulator
VKTEDENQEVPGLNLLAKADALIAQLEARTELSVPDLAQLTGEPASSIYRLTGTLDALGWLERGSNRGRYRIGPTFLRLGYALERQIDVRQLCIPAMQKLHDTLGETTFLCVRSGVNGVCIERLEGMEVQSLAMRLGDSFPLYRGAAPFTLLAFEEERTRDQLIADLCRDRPGTSDVLRTRIEEARRAGMAWSDGDVTAGIAAAGAPVYDHHGNLAAAISVSGRRETVLGDRARTTRALREAALSASKSLGWTPAHAAEGDAP